MARHACDGLLLPGTRARDKRGAGPCKWHEEGAAGQRGRTWECRNKGRRQGFTTRQEAARLLAETGTKTWAHMRRKAIEREGCFKAQHGAQHALTLISAAQHPLQPEPLCWRTNRSARCSNRSQNKIGSRPPLRCYMRCRCKRGRERRQQRKSRGQAAESQAAQAQKGQKLG